MVMKNKLTLRFGQVIFTSGLIIILILVPFRNYTKALISSDGVYIPQPSYKVTEADLVESGKKFRHTYRIFNARPRQLRLSANPDCGCTFLSWSSATIPPYGWKDLVVETSNDSTPAQKWSLSVGLQTNLNQNDWKFIFLKS